MSRLAEQYIADLEKALEQIRDNCPGSAAIMARAALGEHRYIHLASDSVSADTVDPNRPVSTELVEAVRCQDVAVADRIEAELAKRTGVHFGKGQGDESELAQQIRNDAARMKDPRRARLDIHGTAKPKTEIAAVIPAEKVDTWGFAHAADAVGYVVKPETFEATARRNIKPGEFVSDADVEIPRTSEARTEGWDWPAKGVVARCTEWLRAHAIERQDGDLLVPTTVDAGSKLAQSLVELWGGVPLPRPETTSVRKDGNADE